MKTAHALLMAGLVLTLSACANPDQTNRAVGTVVGGTIGGVAGAALGGGSGSVALGIAGAAAGAYAGNMLYGTLSERPEPYPMDRTGAGYRSVVVSEVRPRCPTHVILDDYGRKTQACEQRNGKALYVQ